MQGRGLVFKPGAMTHHPVIREKKQGRVQVRVPVSEQKGHPVFSAQATPDSASQRFSPRSVFRPPSPRSVFRPQAPDPFPNAKQAKVANRFRGVEESDQDAPIRRIPYGEERAFQGSRVSGRRCHDCGAYLGELHDQTNGCDFEECPLCLDPQLLYCGCPEWDDLRPEWPE
jgi:hypothetical protein